MCYELLDIDLISGHVEGLIFLTVNQKAVLCYEHASLQCTLRYGSEDLTDKR